MAVIPIVPRVVPRQQAAITTPEEESLLRTIGSYVLPPLSYFGALLDLPGSMIRDILALENPLDQLLHPFSWEHRVSGQELLRRYGLVKGRRGWGPWLAGLATEIVLDPLTWATFGVSTLGKAGKVFRATGAHRYLKPVVEYVPRAGRLGAKPVLVKGVRELLLEGTPQAIKTALREAPQEVQAATIKGLEEAGLLGKPIGPVGLRAFPIFGPVVTTVGGRRTARVLDTIGHALRTNPVTRHLAQYFSAAVRGTLGAKGQEAARSATQAEKAIKSDILAQVLEGGEEFTDLVRRQLANLQVPPTVVDKEARRVFETVVENPALLAADAAADLRESVQRAVYSALFGAPQGRVRKQSARALKELLGGALGAARVSDLLDALDRALQRVPAGQIMLQRAYEAAKRFALAQDENSLEAILRTMQTAEDAAAAAGQAAQRINQLVELYATNFVEDILHDWLLRALPEELAELAKRGKPVDPEVARILYEALTDASGPLGELFQHGKTVAVRRAAVPFKGIANWAKLFRNEAERIARQYGANPESVLDALAELTDAYRTTLRPTLLALAREAERRGLTIPWKRTKGSAYFPRYLSEELSKQKRIMGVERRELLSLVPGGRRMINAIAESVSEGTSVAEAVRQHLPMEHIRAVAEALRNNDLVALAKLMPTDAAGAYHTVEDVVRTARLADQALDSLAAILTSKAALASKQAEDVAKLEQALTNIARELGEDLGTLQGQALGLRLRHIFRRLAERLRQSSQRMPQGAELRSGIKLADSLQALDKLLGKKGVLGAGGSISAEFSKYAEEVLRAIKRAKRLSASANSKLRSVQNKLLREARIYAELPEKLTDFIASVKRNVPGGRGPFAVFGDPLRDLYDRVNRVARAAANRQAVIDMLMTPGLTGPQAHQLGAETVSLFDVLKDAGVMHRIKSTGRTVLDPKAAELIAARLPQVVGPGSPVTITADTYRRLLIATGTTAKEAAEKAKQAPFVQAPIEEIAQQLLVLSRSETPVARGAFNRVFAEVAQQLPVHKQVADDVIRLTSSLGSPQKLSALENTLQKLRDIWTENVTVPWTAFHVRNFMGGAVQNVLAGALRLKDAPRAYRWAVQIMTGKTPKGIREALVKAGVIAKNQFKTDDEVVRWIERKLAATQTVSPSQIMAQRVGEVGLEPGSPLALLPHIRPTRPAEAFLRRYQFVGKVAEVEPRTGQVVRRLRWMPTYAGRELSRFVEGVNRTSAVLGELLQGRTLEEAAERAKLLHVDYAALTPSERRALLVLFPFYSFFKGMSKFLAHELTTDPARIAAATRLEESLKPRRAPIPQYLRGTEAIPLYSDATGTTYLGSLGLMHRDPLRMLGGWRDIREDIASRMSPFVRKPLEWVLGVSLGRRGPGGAILPIEEAETPLARLAENLRQIVTGERGYRPLKPSGLERGLSDLLELIGGSRYLTTAKRITDPRYGIGEKLMNVLTGIRTYKVSPGAQEAVLRDYLTEYLRQLPESRRFERVYVPQRIRQELPPARQKLVEDLLRAMQTLERRARQRAEAYGTSAPLPQPIQW